MSTKGSAGNSPIPDEPGSGNHGATPTPPIRVDRVGSAGEKQAPANGAPEETGNNGQPSRQPPLASIPSSSSDLGDLLLTHDPIGDWNELVSQAPAREHDSPSIRGESDRKISTSSSNSQRLTSRDSHQGESFILELREPYYAFVSGIDYAATKLEIFYWFGGADSVLELHLYSTPYPDVVAQTGGHQRFSGECFMQLSGFRAFVEVLKKDRETFLTKTISVYHVDPDTFYYRRIPLEQLETARPAPAHPRDKYSGRDQYRNNQYRDQGRFGPGRPPQQVGPSNFYNQQGDSHHGDRFHGARGSNDVRFSMGAAPNQGPASVPPRGQDGWNQQALPSEPERPQVPKPTATSIFGQAKPVDQQKKLQEMEAKLETEKKTTTVPPSPASLLQPSTFADSQRPSEPGVSLAAVPVSHSLTRQSSSSSTARYPYQGQHNQPPPPQQPQPYTRILRHEGAEHQQRGPVYTQDYRMQQPPPQIQQQRQLSTPPASSPSCVPVPLNQCNLSDLPNPRHNESAERKSSGEREAGGVTGPWVDATPSAAVSTQGSESKYRGGPGNRNPNYQQYQPNKTQPGGRRGVQAGSRQMKVDSKEGADEVDFPVEKQAGPKTNRTISDERTHRQNSDNYTRKKNSFGHKDSKDSIQRAHPPHHNNNYERKTSDGNVEAGQAKKPEAKSEEKGESDTKRAPLSKENSSESRFATTRPTPHLRAKEIDQVKNFIRPDATQGRDKVSNYKQRSGNTYNDKGAGGRPDIRNKRVESGENQPRGEGTRAYTAGRQTFNRPKNAYPHYQKESTDFQADGQKGNNYQSEAKKGDFGGDKRSYKKEQRQSEAGIEGNDAGSSQGQTLKTMRSDSTPTFSVSAEIGEEKGKSNTVRANSAEKGLEFKHDKEVGIKNEGDEGGEGKKSSKSSSKLKKKASKRSGKEDANSPVIKTSNKFSTLPSSMD